MEPLYTIPPRAEIRAHISPANRKCDVPSLNLLPGNEPITLKDGRLLSSCAGSCGAVADVCAGSCYAMRAIKRHHNSMFQNYLENTYLARNDTTALVLDLADWICEHNPPAFRFHVSGEFVSASYVYALADVARAFPSVRFFAYTKRPDIVAECVEKHGKLPRNFAVSVSMWRGMVENPLGLAEFHLDDGTDPKLYAMPHCPAVSAPIRPNKLGHATGVTCSQCRRCIDAKPGQKTAVYLH